MKKKGEGKESVSDEESGRGNRELVMKKVEEERGDVSDEE